MIEVLSPPLLEKTMILPRSVSAIQRLSARDGDRTKLGLITQLPEGAEIHVEGPGFSERTIAVFCAGCAYYVFVEDLELMAAPMAAGR